MSQQIVKISEQPNGILIFQIGFVPWNGPAIPVTATMSRKNCMEKSGGWYITLATHPTLDWDAATARNIYATSLIEVFLKNERLALRSLFPEFSESYIDRLACAIAGDTKHTTNRPDLHAHVYVAFKEVWASKQIRRMDDDTRSPERIRQEAVDTYLKQQAARALMEERTNPLGAPDQSYLDTGHPG